MKNLKSKNLLGFTLIELLIVIAIIGILAVAFLPTLLDAPSKARDSQRVADVQKIQKVMLNAQLERSEFPGTTGPIEPGLQAYGVGETWETEFNQDFSGVTPSDPRDSNILPAGPGVAPTAGTYFYLVDPNGASVPAGTYAFGIYARVENFENANTQCDDAYAGVILDPTGEPEANWCYAVLAQ